MRKSLVAVAAMVWMGSSSVLHAAPLTENLNNDVYDSAPDLVPTPNQHQDFLDEGGINNDIRDAINVLLSSSFNANEDVDHLQHGLPDEIWKNSDGVITAVGVGAGSYDTLMAYHTAAPDVKVDVFGGAFTGFGLTGDGLDPSSAFLATTLPFAPDAEFGWALQSIGSEEFNWDSNPSKNSDGLDHMLTYKLPSLSGKTVWLQVDGLGPVQYTFVDPYVLAWEDLPYSKNKLGDEDYNDLILVVDRVAPVPEPMTVALLGSGLIGAFALRRRTK